MAGRKNEEARYSFDNTSPSLHQIYESPQQRNGGGNSSGRKKKRNNRPGRSGAGDTPPSRPAPAPSGSPAVDSDGSPNRHHSHTQSFEDDRKRKEEAEAAECSFEPAITPFARELAQRGDYVPIEDRMQRLEEERRRRIEQLEEQLERENGKVYTFKPKVTKYEFKNPRDSVVSGLEKKEADRQYRLGQMRKEAEKEELADATFKPQLSRRAQEMEMNEGVFDRLYQVKAGGAGAGYADESSRPASKTFMEAFDEARLYKEAELRREKHKKRLQRILEDEGLIRNERKITESSRSIAQAKLQKALMDVFDRLANQSHMLDFESLSLALYQLGFFRKNKQHKSSSSGGGNVPMSPGGAMAHMNESDAKIHQQLWNVMDKERIGHISSATFLRVMSYVLDPTYHGNDLDSRSAPKHLRELRRKLYLTRLTNTGIGKIREKTEAQLEKQFKENYTFKPQINESSKRMEKQGHTGEDTTTPGKTRADRLIAKRKKHEDKIEMQRLQLIDDELRECTFKPKISTHSRKMASDGAKKQSFAERLSKPKAGAEKAAQKHRPREEEEMDACTFKPDRKLTKKKDALAARAKKREQQQHEQQEQQEQQHASSRPQTAPGKRPSGYEASIERMKRAQAMKKEKEERYNNIGRPPTAKEMKRVQKLKPFKFADTEKVKETAINNPVLMYMDVNIAPGKTGRVAIHSGDNPKVLAHNFAAIYLLTDDLCSTLEGMIREHMEAMQIPMTNQVTETWGKIAWSPHIDKISANGSHNRSRGTGGQAEPLEMS